MKGKAYSGTLDRAEILKLIGPNIIVPAYNLVIENRGSGEISGKKELYKDPECNKAEYYELSSSHPTDE